MSSIVTDTDLAFSYLDAYFVRLAGCPTTTYGPGYETCVDLDNPYYVTAFIKATALLDAAGLTSNYMRSLPAYSRQWGSFSKKSVSPADFNSEHRAAHFEWEDNSFFDNVRYQLGAHLTAQRKSKDICGPENAASTSIQTANVMTEWCGSCDVVRKELITITVTGSGNRMPARRTISTGSHQSGCPLCRIVFWICHKHSISKYTSTATRPMTLSIFAPSINTPLYLALASTGKEFGVIPVHKRSLKSLEASNHLEPKSAEDMIDMFLVQKVLDYCGKNHAMCNNDCGNRVMSREAVKTYLIDLQNLCLVETYTDEKYFALSYVNGEPTCSKRRKIILGFCRGQMLLDPLQTYLWFSWMLSE